MVRTARIVVPGIPHHITQRGNNQAAVFLNDKDYRRYLGKLLDNSRKHDLVILGYCLMPNHVHLIGIPQTEGTLAKAVGLTHLRYSQLFNESRERSGHLWQNRFYSCPLSPSHAVAALRYIELNPVRAGLVGRAWLYQWSSAGAIVLDRPDFLIDKERRLEITEGINWQEALTIEPDIGTELLSHTRSGRPFGENSFIDDLEMRLKRRLRPLKGGRPKKKN
jgi:REP-associated tyrosine transposase